MFISRLQSLRERGDTIVEVLIAVTIMSMVLGGAFVTTNRSMQTSRTTEEHGTGLKLAESQLEQIKGLVSSDPSKVFDSPYTNFCVYVGEVYDSSNANCRVDIKGKPLASGVQYALSVARSNNTFTVNVRWDKVGGGQNNVRMVYRIHE